VPPTRHTEPRHCLRAPSQASFAAELRNRIVQTLSMERPTAIDLFCGAGGLSIGLERAGWRTVAAVDCDRDSIASMESSKRAAIPITGDSRTYLEGTRIVRADIANISASDLRPAGENARWRPTLLAGGPPCQPFSSAGRMRSLQDPRGRLFVQFVRIAAELRPRFILFENVPGLVTARSRDGVPGGVLRLIQREFERIGYACRFELLNAADYGAPQRRVRLYMVAAREESPPNFPPPTHAKATSLVAAQPWVTLGEFLESQPRPEAGDVVRPTMSRERELSRLKPGTGLKAGGLVEANRPGGHWGYRQDCFLADPRLPSRTIRAAATPDWIRDIDGTLRRLTWRECAALQGFPYEWNFEGTVTARFRQIGNAVQGHIGSAIGSAILSASRKRRVPDRAESFPWPPSFHKRVRYTAMEDAVNGAVRAAARERRSA